ncbi:MAG: endolytic transglycosylase MltG [Actinocatenispora sp.]
MLEELELAYEESDADMRGGRHRRRRKRGGRSLFALVVVLALLAGLGGAGYWGVGKVRGFFTAEDYPGSGDGSVQVQVKTGQGLAEIGNTLYAKHVVKSAGAFVDACGENPNATSIQPGYYKLRLHMKASLAVGLLLDLKNRISTKITIPEGKTTNATLTLLAKALKLPLGDFKDAVKDPGALGIGDNWFTRSDHKKVTKSVEGFLFPDTYQFDPGTTAKDALGQMVDRFMQNATDTGLDKPSGITPYDALIVASLVQGEGLPKDMPKVAKVIYNRLDSPDEWMHKLQFDSTTNYWLDKNGDGARESRDLTSAQLHDKSNPYNTTEHAGLPPGPIDSPGAIAMRAATHPAEGNWLYFVRINKDGTSAFTDDYDVQQANERKAEQNGAG